MKTWRRSHRRALAALPLGLLLAVPTGCLRSGGSPIGIETRSVTRFASEWKRYLAFSHFKALAVAGDPEGAHVTGYAHAYPGEASARTAALEACEVRRADRRIAAPCRIYAEGDDRLEDGAGSPGGD